MEYTQKSVARLVSTYFFCLLATSVFLHASFMQFTATPKNNIPTIEQIEALHAEMAFLETRSIQAIEIVESDIEIEHNDITGLKRIVQSKRKRNARKNAANSPSNFVPSSKIPALPIAYNELFDSLDASDKRINIINEAKKYLGLRYVWGGTTPKGFDCSGFTSYVLAQKGVGVARSSRYQAQQGQAIDLENAKTGDLIFFSKYGKGGRVTHVAMVVDNKEDGVYIIHSTRRGIVVDNLSESSYWKPKMLYAKDMISKG